MIAVFSFCTCSTAYAYTGYPSSFDNASSIFYTYYSKDMPDAKPVALVNFDGKTYLIVDKAVGNRALSNLIFFKGFDFETLGNFWHPLVIEFSYDNCYSKPTIKYDGITGSYGDLKINSSLGFNIKNFNSGKFSFIYSVVDVYDYDGNVVFQKGTSQSPNPTTPDSSTPGSNTLSTMFNKNSAMLKGVLNEILALLPLLLPVLISFLAIRKGIKFTLQTLRSA